MISKLPDGEGCATQEGTRIMARNQDDLLVDDDTE